MFDVFALQWNDIKSKPKNGLDYINLLSITKEKQAHLINYKKYIPRRDVLTQIDQRILGAEEKIKILGIGASWCDDCQIYVSQMVKIQEQLKSNLNFQMLGGIKKKLEGGWAVPPSPPESIDPIFDLDKIPTFYLFKKTGACFGRIVEKPIMEPTLEEEILSLIINDIKKELH
jgi:hypothetical protein